MALAAVAGFLIAPVVGWRAVMIGSSVTALLAVIARRSMHLPDEPAMKHVSPTRAQLRPIATRMFLAWVLGVFKLGTYWTCYTWLPVVPREGDAPERGQELHVGADGAGGAAPRACSPSGTWPIAGAEARLRLFSVTTAAAIATLAFRWEYLSPRPPLFWATMFCLGLGSGCTAGFGALLAELFPTQLRSFAMGTTYNMARAAQLGAPVLVSWAVACARAGGRPVGAARPRAGDRVLGVDATRDPRNHASDAQIALRARSATL